MKIQKIGHCCLLIKINNVTILTDPGTYTIDIQKELKSIDIVLITHEHPDHFHIDSLKAIIANNPNVEIITNTAVGKLLDNEGISYRIVDNNQNANLKNIKIEGFGELHKLLHKSLTPVQNVGYFLNDEFFYPGDALTNPNKKVDILALPVAGPWINIGEAIDYAIEIKPRICFPVHDAGLKEFGPSHRLPGIVLDKMNIKFIEFDNKGEIDINSI